MILILTLMRNIEMSNLDTEKPYMIRSLSKHHWQAGYNSMLKNNSTVEMVGTIGEWQYYLVRANTNTTKAKEITMKNGIQYKIKTVQLF